MTILTESQASNALIAYVDSNLPNEVEANNNGYPNQKTSRESNVNWFNYWVSWATSSAITAGTNALHRVPGTFIIDINIPKGTGDSQMRIIQDHLIALFKNNQTFRTLGFAYTGHQIDPFDERPDPDFYIERFNLFFYVEN